MRLILILTAFVIASATAIDRPKYDLSKAQEYFERFIAKYNKKYDLREKVKRLAIFTDNLRIINRLNKYKKGIYGITRFSDQTGSEFQKETSGLGQSKQSISTMEGLCKITSDDDILTDTAPEKLDYRDQNAVSSVKDQIPCNSCWAFVAVGSLEGAYALKHKILYSLSAQQLMDCLPASGHCMDGGNMTHAFSELINKAGVMADEDYPYVAKDEKCRYDGNKVRVNVTSCTSLQLRDENKLKEALKVHGPIGLGISTGGLQNYKGGIVGVAECPTAAAEHAVLLVGYGTSEEGVPYWIIKNSWGTEWGEKGYLYLERGHNVCGLMTDFTSAASVE